MAAKKNFDKIDVLIGADSRLEGTIHSDGSVRVEGSFKGKIHAKGDITIGEQGDVQADLEARNIMIAGLVRGNVEAKQIVTLLGTGRLNGDLVSKSMAVEQGGIFNGNSKMLQAEPVAIAPVKQNA